MVRIHNRSNTHGLWIQYRVALTVTCLVLGVAGHFGSRLTHGANYLLGALPGSREAGVAAELLGAFSTERARGLTTDQLDRLNLEVRALFAHRCYQCHSTEKQEAELALDTQEGVRRGGESGPILVVGQAEESEIIRRLELPRDDKEAMPGNGRPLSRDKIDLIRMWINLDAPWAADERAVFPEARLALSTPAKPPVRSGKAHPVDRFVDAYFENEGIRWPDPDGDRTFVRRAYLDAVGLLPTPQQLDDFLLRSESD